MRKAETLWRRMRERKIAGKSFVVSKRHFLKLKLKHFGDTDYYGNKGTNLFECKIRIIVI